MKTNFFQDIKSFPVSFWLLNIVQFFEKGAFVILWLQIPVYIGQKDALGGLHWEQTAMGWLILWWILIQRIPPIFSGALSDKYGYKKTLFFSFFFIVSGYLIMGSVRDFYPFLAGTLFLGFGSGIYLPAVQGALSHTLENRNSSLGWGIYYFSVNFAAFAGAFVSQYLKTFSWEAVFWGAASFAAINLLILALMRNLTSGFSGNNDNPIALIKKIFTIIYRTKVKWFILLMSGFSMIYMQFYKTFTNFIYDWVDTSGLVQSLGLPAFMTLETSRGIMISYEMMLNLNALLVFCGIVFISWLLSGVNTLKALITGIIAASLGIALLGVTSNGYIAIAGILVYTVGEMITNPKFNEYLSKIAPQNEKALYMSYLNISFGIGLGAGSVIGGYLYGNFAEKASLAKRYLVENMNFNPRDISLSGAMAKLEGATGLSPAAATDILWDKYHPYLLWLPFFAIGILSAVGMYFYYRSEK